MTDFFHACTIILVAIILITVYRVIKGTTLFDRIVGVNAIATKTIVLICLIGYVYERIDMFIDITLAYSVLGFVGSIAIAKYLSTQESESA
jgi:multicomponent Na+:H+ antiporter subunit F